MSPRNGPGPFQNGIRAGKDAGPKGSGFGGGPISIGEETSVSGGLELFQNGIRGGKDVGPKGGGFGGDPHRLEKKRVPAVDLGCFKMVLEPVKTLVPKGVDLGGTHIDWRRNESPRCTWTISKWYHSR